MKCYAINKSGKKQTVYESNAYKAPQIGTLYHNECFGVVESKTYEGTNGALQEWVYFKSSSGVKTGYMPNSGGGEVTPFLNYSFGTIKGPDGYNYKTLKTRKALTYYDKNGKYKGTCVSGARILTNDTTPGVTMPYCMTAMYVETGVNTNKWILISGNNLEYGFIDTGIASGCDASKIGIYGNW